MQGQAAVAVRAPDGTTVFMRSVPIAIALNDVNNTFDLGALDTSDFASGVYTVEVDLTIQEPPALAELGGAQGYGLLSVGQGISAAIDVAPAVVAPGDAVVTTTISTERTNFGSGAGRPIGGTPIATQTLQLVAPANVSNNNPNAGVALHLEAGTYDVVIADGAVRHSVSGAWFDTVRASVNFTGTIAREYWLGYGTDAFTGGSPTAEEAIATNRGKFVCIHLPQAADLRFWVHDGDRPHETSGTITLTIRKMFEASTTLNRQVEGALGWALPRQQAETLSFTFREQCMACHVAAADVLNNSRVQQIEINNQANAALIVINLSGSTATFGQGNMVGSWLTGLNGRSRTVWNFPQATSINLQRNLMGALLAPNAAVTASSNIDGATAVKSLSTTAEVHKPGLVSPCGTPQPTATPTAPAACQVYPIALHQSTQVNVAVGSELKDIYNGSGNGNFGWLTWTGAYTPARPFLHPDNRQLPPTS